jgi:hypothetical protein
MKRAFNFRKKEKGHMVISQEDRKILTEFSNRVRRVFPAAKIWAFGSRGG